MKTKIRKYILRVRAGLAMLRAQHPSAKFSYKFRIVRSYKPMFEPILDIYANGEYTYYCLFILSGEVD